MGAPQTFYDHAMQGYQDGRYGVGETPSLEQASANWSERASAASTTPRSVLQQVQLSPGNGKSQIDQERVLPGGRFVLPTTNGSSAETNQAQMPLRMAGDLPV